MTAERINTVAVPLSVVGLQQHLYVVDGRTVGLDEAVHAAETDNLETLRELMLKSGKVTKARSERLQELNRAIALLAKVRADMSELDMKTRYASPDVSNVLEIAGRLGLVLAMTSPTDKGEVTKAFAQLQHEIDNESNRLQQAMGPLRNYIGQHDRHFARLDSAMKRIVGMPGGTVRNLG